MARVSSAPKLSLLDAVLCLALSAAIHRSDPPVRATARRAMQRLPRRQRGILAPVIASRSPTTLVELMLKDLTDEQTPRPSGH